MSCALRHCAVGWQDGDVEQRTVSETVQRVWADDIVPSLSGLVEIPALSPAFDPDWAR